MLLIAAALLIGCDVSSPEGVPTAEPTATSASVEIPAENATAYPAPSTGDYPAPTDAQPTRAPSYPAPTP